MAATKCYHQGVKPVKSNHAKGAPSSADQFNGWKKAPSFGKRPPRQEWTKQSRYNRLFQILRDPAIPPDAAFLALFIDSKRRNASEDVQIPRSVFLKRTGWGKTRFYKNRQILEKAGYLRVLTKISADGIEASIYTFLPCPHFGTPPCPKTGTIDNTDTTYLVKEEWPQAAQE